MFYERLIVNDLDGFVINAIGNSFDFFNESIGNAGDINGDRFD